MSSNSDDLLTSRDAMCEAANRRAEAADWRNDYATGYSDGLWDARNKVLLSPDWQKAYEEEQELCTSVVDQYHHLEDEMDGLIHMIDKIRELADASAESEDSADWICGLLETIRLLDGDDA